MDKNELVMELMRLDEEIKQGQQRLSQNIDTAEQIVHELQIEHSVTMTIGSLTSTAPPQVPTVVASDVLTQAIPVTAPGDAGPHIEVVREDQIPALEGTEIAVTPIPPGT